MVIIVQTFSSQNYLSFLTRARASDLVASMSSNVAYHVVIVAFIQLSLYADSIRVSVAEKAGIGPCEVYLRGRQTVAASPDEVLNCSANGLMRPHASAVVTLGKLSAFTPSSLVVHNLWWSRRNQTIPVTVFATVSISRLDALRDFCLAWTGPMSVVAYTQVVFDARDKFTIPDNGPHKLSKEASLHLHSQAQKLAALHQELEDTQSVCQLDAIMAYELVENGISDVAFPINTLRNLAMLQVRRSNLFAEFDNLMV